jgi:N-acyl-D-aspartate/D-glutamate deacylase
MVLDGTGNPWFRADIGIMGDRIASIGRLDHAEARVTIVANERVVSPGFIDIHSHSDSSLFRHNQGLASLRQGLTTQVVGNCGHSMAPICNPEESLPKLARQWDMEDFGPRWSSFAEYLACQERRGLGINIAPLVGHGTVRRFVLGPEGAGGERRGVTGDEQRALEAQVAEAMEAGAFGLSSGLEYPPGRNARIEELIGLCKVVGRYGGLYATHMRSEGQAPGMEWFGAVMEAIEIGSRSGVPVNIAHLKADQRDAWWKAPVVLRMLEEARARGVQITADVYPYPFAAVGYLYSVLPPQLAEAGIAGLLETLADPARRQALREQIDRGVPEWTNPAISFGWGAIGIVETSRTEYTGKSIEDVAGELGADPFDVCFDLLLEDRGLTRSSVGVMHEENIRLNLKHPLTMVSTDGTTVDTFAFEDAPGLPPRKLHPRCLGTYPRVLGRYVRDEKLMPLSEAVRKCTSLPAATAGLKDRGLLREGMHADLVVFDPATVAETGTFADPHRYPVGIENVIVNGQVAISQGNPTNVLAGRVLRRRG